MEGRSPEGLVAAYGSSADVASRATSFVTSTSKRSRASASAARGSSPEAFSSRLRPAVTTAPPTMMDTGSITPTRTSLDRWIGLESLRATAGRTVSDARPRAESLNAAALTGTLVAAKAAIVKDLPNANEPCERHGVTRTRAVQCRGGRAGFNFAAGATLNVIHNSAPPFQFQKHRHIR